MPAFLTTGSKTRKRQRLAVLIRYGVFLVQVFISGKNEDRAVRTLKAGDAFGELALMYNSPRTATVKVAASTGGGHPVINLHGTSGVSDQIVPSRVR